MHVAANKDVYSNWLQPDYFQTLLQVENIRLIRDRLGLPERYQAGTFQAGGGASRVIETDLVPFLVLSDALPVVNGETALTDWYYINDWYTDDSLVSEIVSQQDISSRINHPLLKQDPKYPYAVITPTGLKIWPNTITTIYITYYRTPATPTFITNVNPTTGELEYTTAITSTETPVTISTELEWSDGNKIDIAYRILQTLGINVERQDLYQHAQKLVEGGK